MAVSSPPPLLASASYEAVLAALNRLESSVMKLGLGRMRRALAVMGNPQDAVPVIHLAGSNGKGSTAAMLTQILIQSGRRVGTFISPHLWDVRERLLLQGEPIAPDAFVQAFVSVNAQLHAAQTPPDDWPTYFEMLTLMGFDYFFRTGVDILVLETGLGGRFDATNVVARPLVTAITTISLEHQAILGNTLSAIAAEKAGILRGGVPLVLGPAMPEEARAELHAQARSLGAPVLETTPRRLMITATACPQGPATLSGPPTLALHDTHTQAHYTLGLSAPYQRDNVITTLGVVEALNATGMTVASEAIAQGLAATRWPARFEWFWQARWVVDGSHNAEGFATLAQSIAHWLSDTPLVAIVSLRGNRDPAMLASLLATCPAQAVFCVCGPQPTLYHAPDVLAQALQAHGVADAQPAESLLQALSSARALQQRDSRLWGLAFGSLYTAGALRQVLLNERPVA